MALLLLPLLMLLAALSFLGGESGGMTREERRLADTLSCVQGAGRVRVTLYYAETGGALTGGKRVTGALAVAEGAGQMALRLRLTEALETLLSLPPGSALVLEMGE